MKNKSIFGILIASVCVAGQAKASGLNSAEAFTNSLSPAALALVELPKAALPARPAPLAGDPFTSIEECRIVDAMFFMQPTITDAVRMLSGCMKEVSKQYKVPARANAMVSPWGGPGGGAQGGTLSGILITVSGKIPVGNPVLRDLSNSLRKRHDQLFGHKVTLSSSKLNPAEQALSRTNSIPAALKAAVKGAQGKELEDMGYFFGLASYPANTKLVKMLADVTGYDESDINTDMFQMASGDTAVRSFAKYLRSEAASEAEDTLPESQVIAKNIRNVAAESEKAFLGNQQFANVRLASHNRQEDGDLDHRVLIAQEKDGSFQVLQYTRNPY